MNRKHPKRQISTICIGRKGRDYSDIPAWDRTRWLHLGIHDGLKLAFQPPVGMPQASWIPIVATIFCANAGLIAAWTTLVSVLLWLGGVLNRLFPGPKELSADPQLILDTLANSPRNLWSTKAEYTDSLGQPLNATVQALPDQWGWNGLCLERDVIGQGKSVVIDISNLYPPWLRRFVIQLLIAQVLYGRMHRHHTVDTTEVVFVLDEADQDISREAESAFPDKLSTLGALLKQGREFGLMGVIGVSHMGGASRFVLTNAQYHMLFNMADAESVAEASNTLLLPEGAEQLLPALQPGECLFREAQGPWPHPLLAKVDYFPPCRDAGPHHYDTLPFIPAKRLSQLPELQEALRELIAQHSTAQLKQVRQSTPKMAANAHALLHAAGVNPWFPVARLWPKTGQKAPSPDAQKTIRRTLEDGELANFEQVRIGKANVLLISLTDKGWHFLDRDPPKRKGRGGIVHQHFCHFVRMTLEKQGRKPVLEFVIPNTSHPVDVATEEDGQTHAWELVSECTDNLTHHLNACFVQSDVVVSMTIVVAQRTIRDQLQRQLQADAATAPLLDRVKFEIIETYMDKDLFA